MVASINASTSAGVVTTADTSGILQLQTASTAALTIDASQKVGIGTASPSDVLTVAGNDAFIRVDRTANEPGIDMRVSGSNTNKGVIAVTTGGAMYFTSGGNTERMRITSGGLVTMPYQPCFLAYRTTTQSGTSPFTILFDTVPVNVGSCYDSGTGRFTAPVTGNYHFAFQTLGIVTSWSSFDVFSYKNGGSTPSILSTRPTSTSGSDNASALSTSVAICNLTAGDYIEIKALNTTQIYSDGNAWLKFMGFLIG